MVLCPPIDFETAFEVYNGYPRPFYIYIIQRRGISPLLEKLEQWFEV